MKDYGRYVKDNLELGYYDWCITGCYYAVYQAAIALISAKGYSSKNHDATLSVLISEYYKKGIEEDDVHLIHQFFLDYQDVVFYVESKQKREEASYSSKIKFNHKLASELRMKAILFVNKAKQILGDLS